MCRIFVLIPAAAAALLVVACGGNTNHPTPNTAISERKADVAPRGPVTTQNVSVSGDIATQCKISVETGVAPTFAFDESSLTPEDQSVLAQVARCLTEGPLKGRAVRLTGRADPRGEIEYNMSLGAHRADSAGRYLQQRGVDRNHMTETSRGKLDAIGTDEAGWARDRRVDISLI